MTDSIKSQRRLFIECTDTFYSSANTGIQRVLRNIVRCAPAVASEFGVRAIPVIWEKGRFIEVDAERILADRQKSLTSTEKKARSSMLKAVRAFLVTPYRRAMRLFVDLCPSRRMAHFFTTLPTRVHWALRRLAGRGGCRQEVRLNKNDILLLLDASWGLPIWPAVRRFETDGGYVVGGIHDLFPLTHPDTCEPECVMAFSEWWKQHRDGTSRFLTVSNTTREVVLDDIRRNAKREKEPDVRSFHLGSDLDFSKSGDKARPLVESLFAEKPYIFLVVGSIEPRKNHMYILDAFDAHWKSGGRATLLIIGQHGWKESAFKVRIATHPEINRKLFVFRDMNDEELDYAYRRASGLVIASTLEGFGLPVVEAFQRGLPVLCSDIPIFRELADGRASFYDLADPMTLARAINAFCASHAPCQTMKRTRQKWLTWEESARQMVEQLVLLCPDRN